MPKYRIKEPRSKGVKRYRVSIKIDIPGQNAIQIRNKLEGGIKSNGETQIVNYKLVRRGGLIRLKSESPLRKYIQKCINEHYKSFMETHGRRADNAPVVLAYQEKSGCLLLNFIISLASGVVLALLEPYLNDLSEYLKERLIILLSKKKNEESKQEMSDKGQTTVDVNVDSLEQESEDRKIDS